jgi:putative ABC transport system substrate-binding protein
VERRVFLGILADGVLTGPLVAQAQSTRKLWRIGWLYEAAPPSDVRSGIDIFREEFRKLGYVDTIDYLIHTRYAHGRIEHLPELAAELTGIPVDVLITASTPSALAAMQATRTIPIVTLGTADPVGSGLVRSYDRPGGNVTGTTLGFDEASSKWLELLKTVRGSIQRVAVIQNSTNAGVRIMFEPLEASARALTMTLTFHDFTPGMAAASVFSAVAKDRPHGLVVLPTAFTYDQRTNVFEQVARMRLPAIYGYGAYTFHGGLMSYGPNAGEMAGKVADYVDKILKGARPGDLPIYRPTRFHLVINLKTAKALGLTIPPSLLQRADQVIE